MGDFVVALVGDVDALSLLEIAALLLGVGYLVLAIRESIWCWLCAFFSTAIFTALFASAQLYMDSALQLFYAAMAIYGAWSWGAAKNASRVRCVTRWPLSRHIVAMVIVIGASTAAGTALVTYTDARYPYIDSFTTFASLWATFLVARKVLENWWYWLVIDAISIGIYIERGLEFAALLFAVYLLMIPFGLIAWTRSWRESSQPMPAL